MNWFRWNDLANDIHLLRVNGVVLGTSTSSIHQVQIHQLKYSAKMNKTILFDYLPVPYMDMERNCDDFYIYFG